MTTSEDHPRLRPLDFKPVLYEGMRYLHLRDPLNLTDRNLLIPEPFIPVLPLLDGSRNLQAIQFSLIIRHNLRISAERIQGILQALDEACLLDNGTYLSARAKAAEDYSRASYRLSLMAGETYPGKADELSAYFSGLVESCGVSMDGIHRPHYRGLVSPHIDYARGGTIYARTWSAAASAVRAAELVVILGTDHFSEGFPLTLTRLPYATPLGTLPLPDRLLDRLERILSPDTAYAGELHHRSEHSIELASVWMHYTRQGKTVDMLPVLVGDLENLTENTLGQFVKAIQRETRMRRTIIIAAVDLAHVGPAFGGDPVSKEDLEKYSADDSRILQLFDRESARDLHAELLSCSQNNICGAHPLYLTSLILGPVRTDPLGYAVCPADDENNSFVTIAGVGLY